MADIFDMQGAGSKPSVLRCVNLNVYRMVSDHEVTGAADESIAVAKWNMNYMNSIVHSE